MMHKMRLNYYNKSELISKFVTPEEVCEMHTGSEFYVAKNEKDP